MTVPVPLTDIESLPMLSPSAKVVPITPAQRDALCEALRIAVEGLDDITRDPVWPVDMAAEVLAAVRELVDLGGDNGWQAPDC